MAFPPKPRYSKAELINASEILIKESSTQTELTHATEILKKWRAGHAYPINTFQSTLRRKVRSYGNVIVAQRLKRAPTIIGKLGRISRLNLANMQDIGGVRAVLKSPDDIEKLRDFYINHPTLTHKLENQDDYIIKPKADGYRGIHLIYRYNLNRPVAKNWNGLLIEMQLRTELQHYWATAVEVTGTILDDPFKFGGKGHPEWREFFKLISCVFALIENRPVIRGYENFTKLEIVQKIVKIEKSLDALQKMDFYSAGLKFIKDRGSRQNKYHILSLNLIEKNVTIYSFPKLDLAKASEVYAGIEKETDKKLDTVLVSTAKSDDLRRAYPNYFLDVTDFTKKVREIVKVENKSK
jgi:putative GTP pyrophosphokinase